MSQIKVDSIVPRGGLPSGSQGGIIQVRQALFKTHQTYSSLSNFTDIGISCDITPVSASNHILIHFGVRMTCSSIARYVLGLVRGSTMLDIGNTGNGTAEQGLVDGTTNANRMVSYPNALYLDTGISTTSTTTYKIQIRTTSNISVNFRNGSTSGCSFMTLMEVSA